MSVMIAHARKNEFGKYQGGAGGDQTGEEVAITKWYSRPWTHVIRCKDKNMAQKIADAMTKAANNNLIGYNQLKRNTAFDLVRKVGYDPAKIDKECNTDCSALVSLACMYAGIPETILYKGGNSSTTSNLRSRLKATGAFEIFSSKEYTQKTDKLLVGDILLSEGHHVAVVVKSDVITKDTKSITEIAREVKAGKWGNDPERRMRLTAAGYDYEAVRTEVNRLIKENA